MTVLKMIYALKLHGIWFAWHCANSLITFSLFKEKKMTIA